MATSGWPLQVGHFRLGHFRLRFGQFRLGPYQVGPFQVGAISGWGHFRLEPFQVELWTLQVKILAYLSVLDIAHLT